MPKSKKPATNKANKAEPTLEVEFDVNGSGYDGGGYLRVRLIGKDEPKPPKEPKKYTNDWYNWNYRWGPYGSESRKKVLLGATMHTATTCCGFDELGNFTFNGDVLYLDDFDDYDDDDGAETADLAELKKYANEIGERWKKLLEKKTRYFCCYIPDLKKYEVLKKIVEKAGLKKGVSVPSRHEDGRYTNTRWEFFPAVTPKEKK